MNLNSKELVITQLEKGLPAITPAFGATLAEAAYGIAFLIIQELTDYTVIERSRRGTGFDYWLGKKTNNNDLPFQNAVRLEVSGIRKGDDSRIKARIKQKLEQVRPTDGKLPAYIVVVEFSNPLAFIVKK